jgi:pyridoxine 4-dehydrogenase
MSIAPATSSLTITIGGDLEVNRIGYGALYLTGPGMWGPTPDPDNAVRLLRRAVDLGVNFIDTADSYGPDTSEQIIRQALHPYPENLVISTKGGLLRSGPRDWAVDADPLYVVGLGRPEYLRQRVEMSLRNLGLDRIDLYQLHHIDRTVPLQDQLGELVRLREQGKIRHIGISHQPWVSLEQLQEAVRIAGVVSVENLYNISTRGCEPVLRYAEDHGLAFIPWFPLGHGGLVQPTSVLSRMARDYGVTSAQLGLAWLLHHSPATILIPGTTSIPHLEENLKAGEIQLDDASWAQITEACGQDKEHGINQEHLEFMEQMATSGAR